MAERVGLGEALMLMIFGIAVTFIGLEILAICISALKKISNSHSHNNNDNKRDVREEIIKPTNDVIKTPITGHDNEELIAVIAASIAATLGVTVPEVRIRSIRRIPQNTPVWALTGRHEVINNKLQK